MYKSNNAHNVDILLNKYVFYNVQIMQCIKMLHTVYKVLIEPVNASGMMKDL